MAEQMSNIEAIKKFFGPPKVTLKELKVLTVSDRAELGKLCARELGVTIVTKKKS